MCRSDRHQEKKDGLFSKRVIIGMFTFLLGFIIWVMIIFSRTGMEPVTLIVSVFALFTGQFGFLHLLTKQRRQLKHEEILLDEDYFEETETYNGQNFPQGFDELIFKDPPSPAL